MKMKNYGFYRPSLLLMIAISAGGLLFCASCTKLDGTVGDNYVQSLTSLKLIDTLTPELSTFYLDSLVTDNTGEILLGHLQDSETGNITAESYLPLDINKPTISQDAVFDSLTLFLSLNHYAYGDTTQPEKISVYHLSEQITADDNGNLFNTSSFAYDPTPIGEADLLIQPNKLDTISIKLPADLGKELFDKIKDNADQVSSNDKFSQYFKGLLLKMEGVNNTILGFKATDTATQMRLYYHDQSIVQNNYVAQFPLNPTLQFNNIKCDRSGALLNGINSENRFVASSQTGGKAFMQPLANVAIKIDFPYLRNILTLAPHSTILKATMTIKPVNNYSNNYNLPPQVNLLQLNSGNVTVDSIINASTGSAQYGDLQVDNLYHKDTYYTYDITSYLKYEIAQTDNYDKTSLLMFPPAPDYKTQLNKLTLGDAQTYPAYVQVKIYYLLYNN